VDSLSRLVVDGLSVRCEIISHLKASVVTMIEKSNPQYWLTLGRDLNMPRL